MFAEKLLLGPSALDVMIPLQRSCQGGLVKRLPHAESSDVKQRLVGDILAHDCPPAAANH